MTRDEYNKQRYNKSHRINDNGKEEKYCNNCKKWKIMNLDNFYVWNQNKSDGFHPQCKECCKKSAKINKSNNKERYSEYDRQYRGRDNNKEIMNERSRQWMVDNREYAKNYIKLWQQSEGGKQYFNTYWHEKGKQHQHDISEKEWESCKKYFNYKCAYCGMPLELHKEIVGQDLHREHKDHNGSNGLSNCVPSCRLCNSTKHDKLFDDWYNKSNTNYTKSKYNKIIRWTTEGYKDYVEEKPPYRIVKKRNKNDNKFHWQLWLVDEKRNMTKCIEVKVKKKEIIKDIEGGILDEILIHEVAK